MNQRGKLREDTDLPKNLSKDTTGCLVSEVPHVEVHVFTFSAMEALQSSEKGLK